MTQTFLFQGNPQKYDLDSYLATHSYIYWNCPQYQDRVRIGDAALLWRSGANAGIVARGIIAEPPIALTAIKFSEYLGTQYWNDKTAKDALDRIVVGIELSEVRITAEQGMLRRAALKDHTLFTQHRIITNPVGTIFELSSDFSQIVDQLWGDNTNFENVASEGDETLRFSEGNAKLYTHLKRERSSALRKVKVDSFYTKHSFLHCELCKTNLEERYPSHLAQGFIEVHHVKPIASLSKDTPMNPDDLILVCPNCHRMIHRTKEAEKNLHVLREWFLSQ